jgi:hypothetical protein
VSFLPTPSGPHLFLDNAHIKKYALDIGFELPLLRQNITVKSAFSANWQDLKTPHPHQDRLRYSVPATTGVSHESATLREGGFVFPWKLRAGCDLEQLSQRSKSVLAVL